MKIRLLTHLSLLAISGSLSPTHSSVSAAGDFMQSTASRRPLDGRLSSIIGWHRSASRWTEVRGRRWYAGRAWRPMPRPSWRRRRMTSGTWTGRATRGRLRRKTRGMRRERRRPRGRERSSSSRWRVNSTHVAPATDNDGQMNVYYVTDKWTIIRIYDGSRLCVVI